MAKQGKTSKRRRTAGNMNCGRSFSSSSSWHTKFFFFLLKKISSFFIVIVCLIQLRVLNEGSASLNKMLSGEYDLYQPPLDVDNDSNDKNDSATLFLQHCAHQNLTSNGYDDNYSKFCIESCSTFTPECESTTILTNKWGNIPVSGHNLQPYTQSSCCQNHGMIRISVLDFFHVANTDPNMTAWLDHGSALGQVRHNGTIVPWDDDVDVAFLVHDPTLLKEESSILNGYSSVLWTKKSTERLMKRLVKKLNQQVAWKYNNINYNSSSNTILWWSYQSMYLENKCIQYQLRFNMAVDHFQSELSWLPSQQAVRNSANIGLFGVQLKNDRLPPPPPKIQQDGVVNTHENETTLLVSTKYAFTCFNTEAYSESFMYYMFPPIQCSFFNVEDTIVWCPRNPVEYVKAVYGPSTMARPKAHSDIYSWSPANLIKRKKKITNTNEKKIKEYRILPATVDDDSTTAPL